MMKNFYRFTILYFLLLPVPALAHSGHEHVSDLERLINGLGVLVILLAAIYVLNNPRKPDEHE